MAREKVFLDQVKGKLESTVSSRTIRKAVLRDIRELSTGVGIGVTQRPMSVRNPAGAPLSPTESGVPAATPLAVNEIYREATEFRANQETAWKLEVGRLKKTHDKKLDHLDIQLRSEQYEINKSKSSAGSLMCQLAFGDFSFLSHSFRLYDGAGQNGATPYAHAPSACKEPAEGLCHG